jgi:type IV secretory pathway VirB9-like protein
MKYANEQEKQYLNYHRLYTAKTVRRVSIYDDGKFIVVERAINIKEQPCLRTSKDTIGYC